MAFIGNQPTAVPLTSSQLADGLITTDKLAATAVTTAKLASTSVTTAKVDTAAITTDKLDLISTASVPAVTAKGTPSVSDGYIQLNCEQNSHGIKLKSPPHSAAQSYTLTFPSTAPTNGTFLQTNSSGVLSFASAGAAAGQVIQVVSATDNTQRSTISTSYVTASNTLSVSITPSSASNKILILTAVNIQAENSDGYYTIFKDGSNLIGANGFKVAYNGAVGARDQFSICYLDSPSTTSAITYQVYFKAPGGSGNTAYVNVANCLSSITVMEIKG